MNYKKEITLVVAFVLFIICVAAGDCKAQTADTVELAENPTELTQVIYDDAKAALASLGAALKVGAEHVYTVLVRQQVVVAYTHITSFILCLLGVIISVTLIRKVRLTRTGEIEDGTIYLIVGILLLLVSIPFLGVSIGEIDKITTGLINPEYGAIKEIMDVIKGR